MDQILSEKNKKNRYFKGKQLQSDDFTLEQAYMELLHRKSNALLFGKGILQGLMLQPGNDHQFQLSCGCAIDGNGNLLCVEKDIPISLQQIEGFDSLEENVAPIYLHYQEHQVDALFCSMSEKEDHMENHHVLCSWKLSIQKEHEPSYNVYFENTTIYEDKDVIVIQRIPSILPTHGQVSMLLEIKKKRNISSFEIMYHVLVPDFEEEMIKVQATIQEHSKRIEKFYFPIHRKTNYGNDISQMRIEGSVQITKQEKTKNVKVSYEHTFPVYKDFISQVKHRMLSKKLEVTSNGVFLGNILIEEHRRTWKISGIEQASMDDYLPPIHLQKMQEQVLFQYGYKPLTKKISPIQKTSDTMIQSGEIRIKDMEKQGDVYTSKEILHGFGPTYVNIHVMLKTQEKYKSEKATFLYQGNMDVLQNSKKKASLGVKVCLEAGSFQVFLQNDKLQTNASIVWTAQCFMLSQPQEEKHFIALEPNMVELAPLSSCLFTPIFDSEDHISECNFFLLNSESGTIREDGVYYAPANEGVYQIQATSAKGESVYAYAYVKEKAKDG